MDPTESVRDAPLVQKVVLLGLVCRTVEGRTPARLDEIRAACNARLDEVTGRLSEADACRALNALDATDHFEGCSPADRSSAGKGRPSYEVCCDVDEAPAAPFRRGPPPPGRRGCRRGVDVTARA